MTESPGRLHRGGQHAEDGESIGSTTRPPYRRPANFWATRWPSRPVVRITRRRNHAQARRNTNIEVRKGVYDYAPTTGVAGAVEWHVNFADPRLFTAYGSGLFAQDEMQVAEHPALAALREVLSARRWPTLTEERGALTPQM